MKATKTQANISDAASLAPRTASCHAAQVRFMLAATAAHTLVPSPLRCEPRQKRVHARLDALWGELRRATAAIVPQGSKRQRRGRSSFEGRARARPPQDDGT